jgi:hypothetical protein
MATRAELRKEKRCPLADLAAGSTPHLVNRSPHAYVRAVFLSWLMLETSETGRRHGQPQI